MYNTIFKKSNIFLYYFIYYKNVQYLRYCKIGIFDYNKDDYTDQKI